MTMNMATPIAWWRWRSCLLNNFMRKIFFLAFLAILIFGLVSVPTSVSAAVKSTVASRDGQRLATLKQMQTAFELFYVDNGKYPDGKNIKLGDKNQVCLGRKGWTKGKCVSPYYFKFSLDPQKKNYIYSKTKTGYEIRIKFEKYSKAKDKMVILTPNAIKNYVQIPQTKNSVSPVPSNGLGQTTNPREYFMKIINSSTTEQIKREARNALRVTDINQISKALKSYHADGYEYPTGYGKLLGGNDSQCLDINGFSGGATCSAAKYLKAIPTDPFGGDYKYYRIKFDSTSTFNYFVTAEMETNTSSILVAVNDLGVDRFDEQLAKQLMAGEDVFVNYLQSFRIKARDSKRLADLKQVQTALELYYTDNNHYPSGTNLILGKNPNAVCLSSRSGFSSRGCLAPYMTNVPSDPSNGFYVYNLEGVSYTLDAVLEGEIKAGNNTLKGKIRVTPGGISMIQ